jgi:hypothetical protein
MDDGCGAVGRTIGQGNGSTRRKPARVPLCPPQIPHDLVWNPVHGGGELLINCDIMYSNLQSLDLPKTKLNSVALVRERTIPTERSQLVGEVSANFCG